MRSVVLIRGLLKGMGREAPCDMLAMKDSAAESGSAVYSQCCVIDAPLELLDGVYAVTFNGYVVAARKEGGLWLPEKATSPLQIEPRVSRPHGWSEIEEITEVLPLLKKDHVA
jgi:predicted outer membrane repeat protein